MNKNKAKKIELFLRTYDQVYGNYYLEESPHLDRQLVDHIMLIASDISMHENLEIDVWQTKTEDKEKFKLAVHNSFNDIIAGINKEFRVNFIIAAISVSVGIFVEVLANIIALNNQQIYTVMTIAFWVFIWYSVEKSVFDNIALKLKKQRIQQIIKAHINFNELDS